MEALLAEDDGSHIQSLYYSPKWSRLPGRDAIKELLKVAQHPPTSSSSSSLLHPCPREPKPAAHSEYDPAGTTLEAGARIMKDPGTTELNADVAAKDSAPKQRALEDWKKRDYPTLNRGSPAWRSCQPPDGTTPPPFIQGVLSTRNCRLFLAAIQLMTRHSFDVWYLDNFRPDADDNTICPCSHKEDLQRSRRVSKCYFTKHILLRPVTHTTLVTSPNVPSFSETPPLNSSSAPKEVGSSASSSTLPKLCYTLYPHSRTPLKSRGLTLRVSSTYLYHDLL